MLGSLELFFNRLLTRRKTLSASYLNLGLSHYFDSFVIRISFRVDPHAKVCPREYSGMICHTVVEQALMIQQDRSHDHSSAGLLEIKLYRPKFTAKEKYDILV